jgi:hypothetical protein
LRAFRRVVVGSEAGVDIDVDAATDGPAVSISGVMQQIEDMEARP